METVFAIDESLSLVFGPKGCGKTRFAFRVAYEAACKGDAPLFITQSMSRLPIACNVSLGESLRSRCYYRSEVLDQIKIKFAASAKELSLLLSSIHLFSPLPRLIVIDDLLTYAQSSSLWESLLMLSAVIQNSLTFLNKESNTQPKVKLITILTCSDLHIINGLKRFYHLLCRFERISQHESEGTIDSVRQQQLSAVSTTNCAPRRLRVWLAYEES